MVTYLIIGGCGFVGSALVTRLLKETSDTIVVLDNFSTSTHSPIYSKCKETAIYSPSSRLTYIYGNSWEIETYCSGLDIDIVFHFGEFSRINQSWKETESCMKSNLYGTVCVLEFCVKNKCKLVYSASSAIFDTSAMTPYTWSKSKMVELIRLYHEWHQLPYLITYFYNVYGPGQIEEGPYSTVIGRFLYQARNKLPLTVVEPGTQIRCFTHINDIIEGILLGVTRLEFKNEFPIHSDQELSIVELATKIQTLFNNKNKLDWKPAEKGNRLKSIKPLRDVLRLDFNWSTKEDLLLYLHQESL